MGEAEVITVDDCSPDGSGAILDAYAKRDRRLRVVRLSTNVGRGRARNAGLAHARGKYVWFVDGDDWLPAGALPAVVGRVATTEPDVLIVDHTACRARHTCGARHACRARHNHRSQNGSTSHSATPSADHVAPTRKGTLPAGLA